MHRVATRQALLESIAREIRDHVPCDSEPCAACTRFVPGEGSADADVVFVGEAPGAVEDQLGRPFVGAAGRILEELLAVAGLGRSDVFITNVVKARPPGNRDPRADEVAHHWPWLEAQLEVIAPTLVVPLGRHALSRFAGRTRISDVHGRMLMVSDRTLFPLYHPAAALHDRRLYPTMVADARALRKALGGLRG